MKIAILNDTHIGARSDSSVFLSHQETFFDTVFFPKLRDESIDTVIHLGDIFDRRKNINFLTFNESKRFFFDVLAKNNITMHTVVGNHDVYYTNTNHINSPDLLLREYSNINISSETPYELTLGSSTILLCPWITKSNSEMSVAALNNSKANLAAGHFEIKGFELMRGIVNQHGFERELFKNFEKVISGHFHHPSKYGNIEYVGAQYEMNWSDHDGRRGFYIYDTETRSFEFIENQNKIHHKLEYTDSDMTLDEIKELDTSMLKNCFVKVVVRQRENAYMYDLFLEKLADSGAADIKTIESSLDLNSAGMEEIINEAKDTNDILNSYIDSLETGLNRLALKTEVNKLYSEALSI